MDYKCKFCNKDYKSYQSLWNHTKKFHSHTDEKNSQKVEKNSQNICSHCKKILCDNHSRWRHEKICKVKLNKIEENNIYKNKIIELENKIHKLEKKPVKKIINYNGPIHNTQNNNLLICNPGKENINLLPIDEKKYIMSQGLNSIISLVDRLNFNENLPQHHNFYVSAINDKHVNAIDNKTNMIIKKSKKDLFDEILFNHMNKLESINKNINYKDFNITYDKLKAFVYLKKGKKEFFNQINMLSYNKKNMIIKTWEKLIDDTTINPNEVSDKFENEVKQITEQPEDSDTDRESNSDLDSDSDHPKILFRQKKSIKTVSTDIIV